MDWRQTACVPAIAECATVVAAASCAPSPDSATLVGLRHSAGTGDHPLRQLTEFTACGRASMPSPEKADAKPPDVSRATSSWRARKAQVRGSMGSMGSV